MQWDREQADTQIAANERRWVPGSSIESDSVYLPGHRALVLVADSDLLPPAGCSSAVGLIVVCLMGRQAAVVNWQPLLIGPILPAPRKGISQGIFLRTCLIISSASASHRLGGRIYFLLSFLFLTHKPSSFHSISSITTSAPSIIHYSVTRSTGPLLGSPRRCIRLCVSMRPVVCLVGATPTGV